MNVLSNLRQHRADILRLAERYGARNVRVFGSAARGEETAQSDIDLLVEWGERTSLSDWAGFQEELAILLGRKVDVVSARGLHWFICDRVLAEARPLP